MKEKEKCCLVWALQKMIQYNTYIQKQDDWDDFQFLFSKTLKIINIIF